MALELLYKKSGQFSFKSTNNVFISSVSLDDIFIIDNVSIRKFNNSSIDFTVPDLLYDWRNSLVKSYSDFSIIGEFNHLTSVFDIFTNTLITLVPYPLLTIRDIPLFDIKYIYDLKKEYIIITENGSKSFKLIYNNYFRGSIPSIKPDPSFKYIDLVKTTTPDVYLIEKDFLYVPDIKTSKYLKQQFLCIKPGKSLNMKCVFNSFFKKWQLDIAIIKD
jgi:hypothetical protein